MNWMGLTSRQVLSEWCCGSGRVATRPYQQPQSVRKVAVTGARQRECELREVDPLPELLLWVGMQSVQAGEVNREVDRR